MDSANSEKWYLLFCELCIKNGFKYEMGKIENPEPNGNYYYLKFGKYRVEATGEIWLWITAVTEFLKLNSPANSGDEGE